MATTSRTCSGCFADYFPEGIDIGLCDPCVRKKIDAMADEINRDRQNRERQQQQWSENFFRNFSFGGFNYSEFFNHQNFNTNGSTGQRKEQRYNSANERQKHQREQHYSKIHQPPPKQEAKQSVTITIELEMIHRLIRLCHPDKHGNSQASNTATKFLMAYRK